MSTRFDLPSGGWVELKDVHELKARDRKTIIRGMPKDDESHPYSLEVDLADLLAQAMMVGWGLPYLVDAVLPSVDIEVLGALEIADATALSELLKPLSAALFPVPATPDDAEVPDSPIVPESA